MKVLIGKKIGMIQTFEENGVSIPVTVLDVSENYISKVLMNSEIATQVEIAKDKAKKETKADKGNYKLLGFVPKFKKVVKFKKTPGIEHEIGKVENLGEFSKGDKVSVSGVTKGRGFAGVVKRYKMKGGPRTHGQSDRERAIGSIGMRTIPGRVWKGKRMAGHMGNESKTIKGLKVVDVDLEAKTILVSGSVPGSIGKYLLIKSMK